MAGPQPLALQLEQLLNPRPSEADPEADPEEGEARLRQAKCGAVGGLEGACARPPGLCAFAWLRGTSPPAGVAPGRERRASASFHLYSKLGARPGGGTDRGLRPGGAGLRVHLLQGCWRDPESLLAATAARVIDRFDEGEDGESDFLPVGSISKQASASLLDTDKRYCGKTTSRRAWNEDHWEQTLPGSSDEEISDEEGSGVGDSKGLGLEESDEDDLGAAEEQESGDHRESKKSRSSFAKTPGFSVQSISDFEKFTEGMDDLGSSEEEEDEESGMEEGDDEEDSEGESEEESEEDRAGDRNSEDDGVVMTFSTVKVSEEVEKGRAVKNQIALWDQLLEGRIKLQKALLTTNQLPQPDVFPLFKDKGGPEFSSALKNSKNTYVLLRCLKPLCQMKTALIEVD
ncbi:hypothetical protein P7K49_011115 [Saguinus oedipus]|uniref:AATF leucine zipper-containing domain-containing protein n=1 Tax=Saguinus oedipus TaxID=9490 RepID=A0ABQ9VR38_SAGOE|nr:hypothetical protein P7K49_011115 [Saguinus oedipus]